ncbi:BRO-N domain-containing protein [Brevundimonas diminuta]|uniref:Uncharacterized phage-encoded protein n=1 Tax=Brevundimonas diminuta TaxID=293 RepID=A0A2X1AMU2_BREDI|nr:BRO family protein [Brevundimonas diminuta]SPU45927.1 Uncharacterized phage-encoded protein [Brevundimonas diminuta]
MTDTTTFAFARLGSDPVNIRTVTIDGDPWFVAADVCRALGVATDHTNRVTSLVMGVDVQTLRRNQTTSDVVCYRHLFTRSVARMRVLSESGLYKLIMRSDKQEALVFQHWIASEVLPSIRKTGKYALADHGREAMPLPMDIAEAVALATAEALRDALSPITQALAAILARPLPEPERF